MTVYVRSLLLIVTALLVVNTLAYVFLSSSPSLSAGPGAHPMGDPPDWGRPPNGPPAGPPRGDGPPLPPHSELHSTPSHPPQPPPDGFGGPPPLRAAGAGQHVSSGRWALAILIEAIVLVPLALLFAHSISAPLRRLAEAARGAGSGVPAAPLIREGPTEVRAALDCFNVMQGRLQKLIQERTQMVGAIAHDLRTPLTRLSFRLDDLSGPLGDRVRADIDEMKSMISAALEFIRERSASGQFERLDLRSLVERVVDEHSDLGHDVQLAAGAPMIVEGVSLALRRMVANLIENGLKYGERVRVQLTAQENQASLQLEDDGPGIPEALHSQVFDPFFRVESSRNRSTGGIGLGLAAVRAIVTEHNGEVRLANRKSGGLRVTVTLPLSR